MRNLTDLPARAAAFADEEGMLPPGTTVLCALSGGADSMALLSVLLTLAERRALTVLAAHYNHQLRGAEAQRDETFVAEWCRTHRVPLTIGRGDVAAQAARQGRGIEETARTMRYRFLTKTAQAVGAQRIATAHNADDNGETLLLHLIRGTGLDGLTGIPPCRGVFIRPLLTCPRSAIEAYLTATGIPHVEDSSNRDVTYTRNRLRQDVLPILRQLNPNFSETLTASLSHLRADRDFLEDLARPMAESAQPAEAGRVLSAQALAALPRPVAVRVVKQVLAQLGRWQLSAAHLTGVCALAAGDDPAACLSLPQGLWVRREYDRLLFTFAPPVSVCFTPVSCPEAGTYRLSHGWSVTLREGLCPDAPSQGPWCCWVDRQGLTFPLILRPRAAGDRMRLPGRPSKSLKKWYIDEKLPRRLRNALPLLSDRQGLVAAAGLGPEANRTAHPGRQALQITFTPPIQQKEERTGTDL